MIKFDEFACGVVEVSKEIDNFFETFESLEASTGSTL
jgi:hypothetical protein